MNFVKMSMIVAVALAGFALQSCEKAAEQTEPNRTLTPAEVAQLIPDFEDFAVSPYTRGEIVSPENPVNPFDHVGAVHNVGLEKVRVESIGVELSDAYVKQLCDDLEIPQELGFFLVENISANDFQTGYSNIVARVENANVRLCIDRLLKTTREGAQEDLLQTPEDLIQYIKHVEMHLEETRLLLDTEKELVLSMTSTYRMSASYWGNEQSSQAVEARVRGFNLLERRSWWRWLVLAAADAVSGFVGGCGTFNPLLAIGGSDLADKIAKCAEGQN